MKKLYLGLNPQPGTIHYPVIRTEVCTCDIKSAMALWPEFTHIIFTSQSAVHYWPGPWDKKIIAIGPATGSALQKKGLDPLIAREATQEGVIELIKEIRDSEVYFFLPRSSRARPLLTDYLRLNNISFFALDLYDTVLQKLEPIPCLEEIDEIIFSSPTTVDGFIQIYGKLPKDKKLTTIGPVTARALARCFGCDKEKITKILG